METQIKRLKRAARVAWWLFVADVALMIFAFSLALRLPGSSVDGSALVSTIINVFVLYALSLIVDFLADLGQEIANIKWGVNDLRRKAVAIRGETETQVAGGSPPETKL